MKKIILADTDAGYLASLERRFVSALSVVLDVEVITDRAYFDTFFSTPRSADILLISEDLYREDLARQDIARIYILTEGMVDQAEGGSDVRIHKYSSTSEVFDRVLYDAPFDLTASAAVKAEPQIVLFYSAQGGSGKTTVAIGTASALSASHRRVLFVSAEYLQTFGRFLTDKTTADRALAAHLQAGTSEVYRRTRPFLRSERFAYLPPLPTSLSSLGIGFAVYLAFIKQAKESGDYDFIVVDTDTALSSDKLSLIDAADRMIVTLTQDAEAVHTARVLSQSISLNGESHCLVCNRYRRDAENDILTEGRGSSLIISEYVEQIDELSEISIAGMGAIREFQKLAMLLM
jgi:MinD-like ATPase involved in chromosome partitioning or flagellar assembly